MTSREKPQRLKGRTCQCREAEENHSNNDGHHRPKQSCQMPWAVASPSSEQKGLDSTTSGATQQKPSKLYSLEAHLVVTQNQKGAE